MKTTFLRAPLAVLVTGLLLSGCFNKSPDQLLASAKQNLEKNDRKTAIVELKNALQQQPSMGEARFLLGKALLASNDLVGAQIELGKATELGYSPDEAIPLLAQVMLARSDYDKLISELSAQTLSQTTAQAELLAALAEAHIALKHRDEAAKSVSEALAANPKNQNARLAAAKLHGLRGEAEAALKQVDEVIADAPDNVRAWLMKSEFLRYGLGRDEDAAQAYRRTLELDPRSIGAHGGLISLQLARHDGKAAQAQLDALKKQFPTHLLTRYYAALVAVERNDLKEASEQAQAMLKTSTEDPRFLHLAGAIAMRSGSMLQAEKYLSQSLKANAENPSARMMLAQTLLRLGEPAKATSTLQPLLEEGSNYSGALALAGEAYLQAGDAKKAEAMFSRAIKVDPRDAQSRTALAVVQIRSGRVEQGLDDLQRLASSESQTVVADLALISNLLSRGESDKALQAIDRLEKKRPELPNGAALRGTVEMARGHESAARAAFEKALSIDPHYLLAITSLTQLDVEARQFPQAIARIEKALADDQKNISLQMALIEVKTLAGATANELVGMLTALVKQAPGEAAPRLALVKHHVAQGDNKAALTVAQEAVSALPDSAELVQALGQVQALSGDVNQAVSSYSKLSSLLPNAPGPLLLLGQLHLDNKDNPAAIQAFRRAVNMKPDNMLAQGMLMRAYALANQANDARSVARAVQRQLPKSADGFVLEAELEASLANWPAAVQSYRSALERANADANLAIKLHGALLFGKQMDEAKKLEATWLRDHPKDSAFREYLASRALRNNEFARAEQLLSEAVKLQPKNAPALNNLAWALSQQKKAGALSYAEQAVKLTPGSPAFWDTLAAIQLDAGQADKALESARKAIGLAPETANLRLRLAQALLATGDKATAKQELQKLADLGSKFPQQDEVKKLQARL